MRRLLLVMILVIFVIFLGCKKKISTTEVKEHDESSVLFQGYTDANITIRDYFAAQALIGLADEKDSPNDIVDKAYKLADAMLERRKR